MEIAVGLFKASPRRPPRRSRPTGSRSFPVAEAAKWADLMMMATPDELQGRHVQERSPVTSATARPRFRARLNVHFLA